MEEKIEGKGAEVASKILKKNLLNIIRKVTEGKTLSSMELSQIQGLADGNEGDQAWAKNQVELADILGVERKTIQRWLKIKGCPQSRSDGRYSIPEFREWASKTGRKIAEDDPDDERNKLEVRRLRTICERLDLELEVARGNYTANDEVSREVFRMVATAKKVLEQMPSTLAPQVVGMKVAEAEKRIKDQVDEVIRKLHEKKWD
jgi:phage terminase Nu1 subunit (DNA packaging protein)